MNAPSPSPSEFLRALAIALFLAMTAAGTVTGGVVSDYRVNGKTIHEGAAFEEFRAIAGEPRAVEPVAGNERHVERVYLCDGAGAGHCQVVAEDGKREMRAHFARGRLKLTRYDRI